MMIGEITHSSEVGERNRMEDRGVFFRIIGTNFRGWLLAVFDGHGGARTVADFCAGAVKNDLHLYSIGKAEETFRNFVGKLAQETRYHDEGSTISLAFVVEKPHQLSRVIVAILGDSPVIVLDQAGKIHVSPEHNARSNVKEREAAISRGARFDGMYIYAPHQDIGLQLTRALGDFELDQVLSREPEIYTIHHPRWILVASDGLLDPSHQSLEEDGAGKIMKKFAQKSASAPDLMNWALKRNLGELDDNATAIVWRSME